MTYIISPHTSFLLVLKTEQSKICLIIQNPSHFSLVFTFLILVFTAKVLEQGWPPYLPCILSPRPCDLALCCSHPPESGEWPTDCKHPVTSHSVSSYVIQLLCILPFPSLQPVRNLELDYFSSLLVSRQSCCLCLYSVVQPTYFFQSYFAKIIISFHCS